MDIREEYIKMRRTNKFNIEWFFKYYLENGGMVKDINVFNQAFQFISIDMENILFFIDKKFNLTILCDSEGNFIKVVE